MECAYNAIREKESKGGGRVSVEHIDGGREWIDRISQIFVRQKTTLKM